MKDFVYHAPATLHEALALLGPSARPLAGGTDLVTLMKPRLAEPAHLVAVRRLLPKGIVEEGEGVSLGAATTLSEIENHALLSPPSRNRRGSPPRCSFATWRPSAATCCSGRAAGISAIRTCTAG
jgi:hypothetical protein